MSPASSVQAAQPPTTWRRSLSATDFSPERSGLHQGLEKLGCAVIPMSAGNTEKQLMLMQDLGVTVLIATPSYALYLSEVAAQKGIIGNLKLRIGFFGAEGCTPEMRQKIEENFGIIATDNYGMSELTGPGVSGECEYRCGLHIWEDHFIPEIIDPETRRGAARGLHRRAGCHPAL